MSEYVRPLEQIGKDDVQQCGGKAANLGELTRLGVRVPPGFCIVADALPYVLEANSLTRLEPVERGRTSRRKSATLPCRSGSAPPPRS